MLSHLEFLNANKGICNRILIGSPRGFGGALRHHLSNARVIYNYVLQEKYTREKRRGDKNDKTVVKSASGTQSYACKQAKVTHRQVEEHILTNGIGEALKLQG